VPGFCEVNFRIRIFAAATEINAARNRAEAVLARHQPAEDEVPKRRFGQAAAQNPTEGLNDELNVADHVRQEVCR